MAERRDRSADPARSVAPARSASELRAANRDRQAVVDRLQNAFVEGRLQLDEYDERVGLAYQAVTYADLAALFTDLPDDNPIAPPAASQPSDLGGARSPVQHPGLIRDLPLALQILWTIWFCVVLINLVVWTILAVTQGPHDFWPIWLLVPGAVLLGVTFGVQGIRRDRRTKAMRRSLAAARRDRP